MDKFRIGQGYDIHRFVEGRKLILAGVVIPFEKGLDGHSDADVVAHALMDALLGAVGLPDIGVHFPNTDPAYKNADSLELLEKVRNMVKGKKYSIGNIDITIIAELPKLTPYIDDMKRNLCRVLDISEEDISIKATTNEKLGALGRGEGIAALAIALLNL